ncbi:MAG TPA: hypothetical protein VFO77_02100 [Actinoplanes sp.]|nr:hypothetical protein [Actinoplanes sp.]
MRRGPMALFWAILGVGLGPALWLGAQLGEVPPRQPPALVVIDQARVPAGVGAGAVPDAAPTYLDTGAGKRQVSVTATSFAAEPTGAPTVSAQPVSPRPSTTSPVAGPPSTVTTTAGPAPVESSVQPSPELPPLPPAPPQLQPGPVNAAAGLTTS